MKKILFFTAAVAALSLTSCNKDDAPSVGTDNTQKEIAAVNVALTKGYVEGSTFYDTEIAKLHKEVKDSAARTMMMSAFHTPQDAEAVAGDYFVGKEFKVADGDGGDGKWHADPKVYWPLGGTLDFLAYSTKIPFEARNISWNVSNASSEVVLYVKEDYDQDDILYAGSTGKKYNNAAGTASAANDGNLALEFGHAQAWIQFQLKTNQEDVIHINKITIENIYKSGELIISRKDGATNGAQAEWSFRGENRRDAVMDDNYKVTADSVETAEPGVNKWNCLTTQYQFMDMLIPEQVKTVFVIEYVLAGQPDVVLTYRYDLTSAPTTKNWEMGKKYVYQIDCNVYEMTVTPTVTEFVLDTFTNPIDPATV